MRKHKTRRILTAVAALAMAIVLVQFSVFAAAPSNVEYVTAHKGAVVEVKDYSVGCLNGACNCQHVITSTNPETWKDFGKWNETLDNGASISIQRSWDWERITVTTSKTIYADSIIVDTPVDHAVFSIDDQMLQAGKNYVINVGEMEQYCDLTDHVWCVVIVGSGDPVEDEPESSEPESSEPESSEPESSEPESSEPESSEPESSEPESSEPESSEPESSQPESSEPESSEPESSEPEISQPESTVSTTSEAETTDNPATGDNDLGIMMVTLLAMGSFVAFVTLRATAKAKKG